MCLFSRFGQLFILAINFREVLRTTVNIYPIASDFMKDLLHLKIDIFYNIFIQKLELSRLNKTKRWHFLYFLTISKFHIFLMSQLKIHVMFSNCRNIDT